MYQQAGGVEPVVFNGCGASGVYRSRRIVEQLKLSDRGRLLDIGCGNGAFLKAVNAVRPGWLLEGAEQSDRNRGEIEALPNVIGFHVGDPLETPGQFDAVSLIHTLEHIPQPINFLVRLREKLAAGGLLVVQVPNCEVNPFALLISDHALHCFAGSLSNAIRLAGYDIIELEQWIPKEITIVARVGDGDTLNGWNYAEVEQRLKSHVEWLRTLADTARRHTGAAVFGSSIAASWLYGEMEGAVRCFVDEDPARIGHKHLGIDILSPKDVKGPVLVPLNESARANVRSRWPDLEFVQ
jgi:SAM-dependent methyltransferase